MSKWVNYEFIQILSILDAYPNMPHLVSNKSYCAV
jgi:hypothetical protein